MSQKISFYIDRGGTFTDVVYHIHNSSGAVVQEGVYKLLSSDPEHYDDAPSEGIRRVLQRHELLPKDNTRGPISTKCIQSIRMGTTVATNALLEHKGVRCALVVTTGFRDVLVIGDQARPEIFKLDITKPQLPYDEVVEVAERLRLLSPSETAHYKKYNELQKPEGAEEEEVGPVLEGPTGLLVEEVSPVNSDAIKGQLERLYDSGIRSVAISLMHSYACGKHENEVAEIARSVGFTHISCSHELMPLIKYVPRTTTAAVDSYLTPLIAQYVSNFRKHFENELKDLAGNVYFIQSDGGLTLADQFFGFRAVLSGPAGGVVGCAHTTAADLGPDTQMVGFDMGGTSTDVCRCEGRQLTHVMEGQIGGISLQAPQVDVTTVAAGGGSILSWENGMFNVGPESAGAVPGPVCYGRGGPLTVTDANLLLGRIDPREFPNVFGPSANEALRVDDTRKAFEEMTNKINEGRKDPLSVEEVAASFIEVANEAMCRPIRNITETKGYRCAEHVLTVFGGAGGQHGCAIAKKLGMNRVYIHRHASFLSAVGISRSDIVEERLAPVRRPLSEAAASLASISQTERKAAKEKLQSAGVRLVTQEFLRMRFAGTTTSLMVPRPSTLAETAPSADVQQGYSTAFAEQYEREFGFKGKSDGVLLVDELRLRVSAPMMQHDSSSDATSEKSRFEAPYGAATETLVTNSSVDMWIPEMGKRISVPVYHTNSNGKSVDGPAMLIQDGTAIILDDKCTAYFTREGNIIIHAGESAPKLTTELHPLPLSLFSHRFMCIAEQMGYTLQRTSSSTNIKERLDFSCAIFDADGNLVANAPHIPVHLGAMGAAVRWQKEHYGESWEDGDVMLSNHPVAGGSHLPDITVMTPCFIDGKPSFYVACRGHHADVGGITPGSMPPFSKSLDDEGAHIKTMRLVKKGEFQEAAITELLMAPGKLPDNSGCRTLTDVLADLRAQVAANHRGVELMKALVKTYGLDVVQAYMGHIQQAAENATRAALKNIVAMTNKTFLDGIDYMDDGTCISLTVRINKDTGDATFDFSNSGSQVVGGTNCPPAVVASAVIYSLRCLLDREIPLNQGCLAPVEIITEPNSILEPDESCAVVAGNVLTSQRVTDVILATLNVAACSQGCMNNFTMGGENFAYYETIAGGAGATKNGPGASAVQVHMTNTRMTDAEILEERYPVLLRQFGLRLRSGGRGRNRGGDGVIRSMLFLAKETHVCVTTERRALPPRGLNGGADGLRGMNLVIKKAPKQECDGPKPALKNWLFGGAPSDHKVSNLGGKNEIIVKRGDIITISTPGGGGYGVE